MHCLVLTVFCFSGSLSATSTADSLSSSFLCNAVNEVSIRTGLTDFYHSAETATCQSSLLDLCHSSIITAATSLILLLAPIFLTLFYSINVPIAFSLKSCQCSSVALRGRSVYGPNTTHCCQL